MGIIVNLIKKPFFTSISHPVMSSPFLLWFSSKGFHLHGLRLWQLHQLDLSVHRHLPHSAGFACFILDLQGNGRSSALRAFVPSVDLIIRDCLFFFNFVKSKTHLPSFLYGESIGGAICLLIHFAILVAPMCKISDKVKPRWSIPQILTQAARFFPTWAIVPTPDLMHKLVKVEEKKNGDHFASDFLVFFFFDCNAHL